MCEARNFGKGLFQERFLFITKFGPYLSDVLNFSCKACCFEFEVFL
jgi:hypothetical protein